MYEDKAGKLRFRLMAGNGEIVAVGEACDTIADTQEGCAAVQRAADGAKVVEADSQGRSVRTDRVDVSPASRPPGKRKAPAIHSERAQARPPECRHKRLAIFFDRRTPPPIRQRCGHPRSACRRWVVLHSGGTVIAHVLAVVLGAKSSSRAAGIRNSAQLKRKSLPPISVLRRTLQSGFAATTFQWTTPSL